MASLIDTEVAALAAAIGEGKPLPELRKSYYEAMLTGSVPARVGTTNGTLVDASQVGYFIQQTAGNVAMTTTTAAVTTLDIPAGVWSVRGMVTWRTSGGGQIALNTSATFPSDLFYIGYGTSSTSLGGGTAHAPERIYNFTKTTTVYLMGNFSTPNTSQAMITAIRIQ